MSRKSAFPAPSPLPGTKKAFSEVQGRALPSSVRKILAKPASRPALALSVKPTATEARPTSPLAVKPQHPDHLQQASALLRKQDEDKVFRSRIPVRIIANTTGRPEHQDNVIRTCDVAQHHPVAKKSLVDSVPKAFRARPSAPNSKIPSFVPVCGRVKPAVTTLQVQPQVSHIQAAGFVSRIPVVPLLVQTQAGESVVLSNLQLESAAVPPLTRKQKRNAALNERRKRKKRAAKLLVSEVPSSSTLVDAILADDLESVPSVPEPESPDSETPTIESQSVDAEGIDLHTGKSQKTAKILKQLEEGHPPFLPFVFVMDCIRPYVPPPTYEVKTQLDDERLHVSNIPLSVPSENIVAYFEKLAGPVKYFSMYLNEDGFYNGKASVIFCNPSDARKAFLLYDGTLIDGRKLKLKLFVNGERLYPNHVTLPPPPGAFQLDWVNAPAPNRVIVPSLDCMREFMSQYPANFIPQ